MKLNTKEFQEALKIVKPGLARNENIEQSTSFAFKDGRIITYNDNISMSHPVDGLDVTGAVIGSTLYDYVTKLKRDEMELKTTKGELRIQCGRSKAGLPLEADIRMPLEELEAADKWVKIPENFADFLVMASGACARDMNLGKLTCVSVNEKGTIIGSDNLRILFCEFKNPKGKIPTFLIPADSAKLAGNIEPTRICVTKSWVNFENDNGTMLSCRKYNDEYEDIQDFLAIDGQQFTFPKTVEDVLIKANIFSKEETAQDEEVTFTVGENRIKIRAEGDHGWFEETVNNSYDEEPFTFSIVPYLLRDILRRTHICRVSEQGMLFSGEDWIYVSTLKSIE